MYHNNCPCRYVSFSRANPLSYPLGLCDSPHLVPDSSSLVPLDPLGELPAKAYEQYTTCAGTFILHDNLSGLRFGLFNP